MFEDIDGENDVPMFEDIDGENDVPMFEVEKFRVALLDSAEELKFMTFTLAWAPIRIDSRPTRGLFSGLSAIARPS